MRVDLGRAAGRRLRQQIRTYVLQPYQLVKDLRTEHETGNVEAVLDGDLDPFMEAWLRQRATCGRREWRTASAPAAGVVRRAPASRILAVRLRAARPVRGRVPTTDQALPMIKLENVTKVYKGDVVALRDAERRHPEGRVRLPRRAVGLGQVHVAPPPQQGGDARRGASGSPARTSASCRAGRSRTCAATSAASSRTSSC